jgi:hypothetical protein
MRAIGVLVVLSGLAAADPADQPNTAKLAIPLGPSKVVEVEPWTPPAKVAQKYPSMKGPDSNAVVIDPGSHGDAQPWPYGIWIKPPASLDDMGIQPGTSDLPDSATLSARLSRHFDNGVGAVLELLMTPRFVRAI